MEMGMMKRLVHALKLSTKIILKHVKNCFLQNNTKKFKTHYFYLISGNMIIPSSNTFPVITHDEIEVFCHNSKENHVNIRNRQLSNSPYLLRLVRCFIQAPTIDDVAHKFAKNQSNKS